MQIAHALTNRPAHRFRAVVESPSDEALLRLIADGEQRAIGILFARHSVRVFRFALSITKDRSLAEEVVSDVFFDIWRRPGSFKGRSRVSTWLLAIARNKALSSLQRHAHEHLNEELAETIEDTADDLEFAMQRKQAGTVLADCLLQLSTIHREIIDLAYYHQKSIEEVAEILKIPRNTVKTRMFYARKHLAEMLAVKGDARTPLLT
jgi:RNA polymerase sigma-70 factor, ECF subfamily